MKQIVTHFFHLELEFFVLDFNVDHSKPMRLSFCHSLPTLQTQNLTALSQRQPRMQACTAEAENICTRAQ